MKERYAIIYDLISRGIFDYYDFKNEKQFKKKLEYTAICWAELNDESDRREYIYQKDGVDTIRQLSKEEENEFNAQVVDEIKKTNGYDYLIENYFGIYEINKPTFDGVDEKYNSQDFLKSRLNFDITSNGVIGALDQNGKMFVSLMKKN